MCHGEIYDEYLSTAGIDFAESRDAPSEMLVSTKLHLTDRASRRAAFTGLLIKNVIAVSMDGKGAWRDNVFVSSGCGAA
jgi:hypothetical protein